MRDGLKTWRGIGAAIFLPYFMSLLAKSLGDGGDTGGALGIVAEAVEQATTSREIWWLPELHRLKGELLLRGARPDRRGAQACPSRPRSTWRGDAGRQASSCAPP